MGVGARYRNPTKKIWTQESVSQNPHHPYIPTPNIAPSHPSGPGLFLPIYRKLDPTYQMADSAAAQPGVEPGNRTVIGISFGNSNSSIAVTVDDKAEVIANEDGGECSI